MTFPIDFPQHPKVRPLSVAAKWGFVEMNAYSRQQGLDGVIPVRAAKTMWTARVLAELVGSHPERPLVQLVDEDYVIRDYEQHQFTNADLADLHEKRALAGSKGGKATANAQALAKGSLEQIPAESESESGLATTRLNQSSHLPKPEIDLTKIIAAVQKNCGRDCSEAQAFLIVGTVMSKAKQKPRSATAFVVTAIQNEPFVFQKMLDEAVSS